MDELRHTVEGLMPELITDLVRLTQIPSIAFPGAPVEPVLAAAEATADWLRRSGLPDTRLVEVEGGYPAVYGERQGPSGTPVVLLYAHYDVQPAPPEQGWTSDPWSPVRKDDGRIYGRGIADDKGGIAVHAGTLQALGESPVTIRVLIEGEEETSSHLPAYVEGHAASFECDVFVIADMGNLEVGAPALSTTLRGEVSCLVTVRTLEHPLHSGVFGGTAPDAMMAMAKLLASLVDDAGEVAVEGVRTLAWDGGDLPEDDLRTGADMLDGVSLIGTGSVASRLWSKPSINAIGIDTTSIADSSNVLLPEARAQLSMRIVPGSDPEAELEALIAHCRSHVPWGAELEIEPLKISPAFVCPTDGPAFAAARTALEVAYGRPPELIGSGGTIPLLGTLQGVAPDAEFILWGPEDVAASRIHASDESVHPDEIRDMVIAQVSLLRSLGV